jgi:hypothetical protein
MTHDIARILIIPLLLGYLVALIWNLAAGSSARFRHRFGVPAWVNVFTTSAILWALIMLTCYVFGWRLAAATCHA